MHIIRQIDFNEMQRRWQIGEGIEKYEGRKEFISSIPLDTKWFLASLPIADVDFRNLRTIKDTGWAKYSGGSFLLCDAADYIAENPDTEPGVWSMVSLLSVQEKVEMTGITLIKTLEEPCVVAEGTHRLVAIYWHCILKGIKLFDKNELEVVLGLSNTKWSWSPM